MATAIASLPNEVPENNVVMKVKETNQKVPNPPQQEPISVQPQNTTELSQESIHQIVQGLQQAGGATVLPNREIPINNNAKLSSGQNEARFAPFETIYTPFDSTSRDLSIGNIKKLVGNPDLGVLVTL